MLLTDHHTNQDVTINTASLKPFHPSEAVLRTDHLNLYYGSHLALRDVTLKIWAHEIIALIGPSGSGKTTLLRSFNRLNDLIAGFRLEGNVYYRDCNLYGKEIDPMLVRRRIGIVFQRPAPFPKSIYDNVAYAPRVSGMTVDLDERVERSLKQVALWDEVKDQLNQSALILSSGQQQQLSIARVIAIQPDILLLDEPCASLDPIATLKIEELLQELAKTYTIILATHNLQQAARVSDRTAFFNTETDEFGQISGHLVEYGETQQIFQQPQMAATQAYVSGRFE